MGKKRQKKGEQQSQNVFELTRIRISQLLHQFRAANDPVYTFQANLSNPERAVVHKLCRKMGLKSKSSGHGNQRRVSVYKARNTVDSNKGNESLPHLTFSEDSKMILQDLFTRYPPEDGHLGDKIIVKHSGKTDKKRGKRDDMFCKPSMNKAEIAKKVETLAYRIQKAATLGQIIKERSKLPIASFRDAITSAIESNQVVLISGETGCGKTTQVPQFILDYIWGKGEACKIVCTQPRRISATSVAERIAYERGENVGGDVGYKIRLESKGGKHSSIVFCTNGILLRVLVSNGTGESKRPTKNDVFDLTHIIVDEIHERDRYSDFMLAIIRDILPSCPNLRLILMSATLDAERFSQYFGGCPVIRVPGFTYPVKSFYLEHVLSILKSAKNNHIDSTIWSSSNKDPELTEEDKVALDEAINMAWSNDEFDLLLDLVSSEGTPKIYNYQHSLTGQSPLMVCAGRGRVGDVCMLLSHGADCQLQANDGTTALEWAERENQQETAEIIKNHMESSLSDSMEQQQLLDKYLETINSDHIDVVLIEQLLLKICIDSQDGAILVFLPGWEDISKTRSRLLENQFFKDTSRFVILSLHSMIPSFEQKKVFKRSPAGCRKIILSTNIAESAITIDDVVYVINSGRMKEKSYDPYNNVSTLQSSWISKASAKQREGRAGRCQPGFCYHLYSKRRATSLPDFQVPEIKRMPIEELCLQVKLLDPKCKIEDFLHKTLDPPVSEAIRNAIIVLQDIGALSVDEQLTELGEKLGCLPVHPSTSKMLFFAILMNCLDPALTLACAADYRDPFILPILPHEKKRAHAAKFELASLYGGHSDQFAVIAAFECWNNAKQRGQEARFCSQYFVSSGTMCMLLGMRKQLQTELIRAGFLPEDVSSCSLNAHDPGILHAVLVAGLYPMVGRLLRPTRNGKRIVVETASGAKVRLHPHSINFKLSFEKTEDFPLVIYDEITRGDGGIYIRNCSVVGPLPLLLLATEFVVAPSGDNDNNGDEEDDDESCDDADEDDIEEDGMEMDCKSGGGNGENIMSSADNSVMVIVDSWLSYASRALDVAQIYCLRERLNAAILFKVTNSREILPPVLGATVYAIACILSYDGLSGIRLLAESVDSLTSMVHATEIGDSVLGSRGAGENGFLKSLMGHNTQRHSRMFPSPYQRTMGTSSHNIINNNNVASTQIQKLPSQATTQFQNLQSQATTRIQKLPSKATTRNQKLPSQTTTRIQKLPSKATTRIQKLPSPTPTQTQKLPSLPPASSVWSNSYGLRGGCFKRQRGNWSKQATKYQ
ncbi:DEAD domain-containing protein/Helicase_C domain-containing protein/R3H domain-containing protein/HA2 domain-containing protein/OB_NTP_bind domain-containing protein/Ank_2 domain-containing protein [Cephalotus follicularis]|uniref:DEAD domain-containing protein/Helicase_C domain-containing protein/R3H domain-containing protein/HA2 domain-containing protein/OB_NTP_bind domain-containing protein/Ank_2 domain-containing protein n=1 Tax=Cephalotus follicularis TaxID=3775 RepID=A0A1Q3AWD6_CEPFO|nr:DEAD domain-containing protein/Helicase_C domain-containing protein/R3H domain-containing protein/HA2 domain-containing protein/OB_NTP_bind domain-containing protein/Ank_2 domain-containing protein [Cephalotus follicularis]